MLYSVKPHLYGRQVRARIEREFLLQKYIRKNLYFLYVSLLKVTFYVELVLICSLDESALFQQDLQGLVFGI